MRIVSQDGKCDVNYDYCDLYMAIKEKDDEKTKEKIKTYNLCAKELADDNVIVLGVYENENRIIQIMKEIRKLYVNVIEVKNVVGEIKNIYQVPKVYMMPEK